METLKQFGIISLCFLLICSYTSGILNDEKAVEEIIEMPEPISTDVNFEIPIKLGWNFISVPLIQWNTSILEVLDDCGGDTLWDTAMWFDPLDQWKTYATFRPPFMNDFDNINHSIGFYLRITEEGSDSKLTVNGTLPSTIKITLYEGVNMVGYPAIDDSLLAAGDVKMTSDYKVIDIKNFTEELDESYVLQKGEGYWFNVTENCTWTISNGLVQYDPIRINSNTDFDAIHGVVNSASGNGSADNPWIIQNYDINGTGYGYCIYIGNTTDYFEVKGCYLHNASGNSGTYYWNSDLILYNVTNGLVKDCVARSSTGHGGILLRDSNENTIEHNYAASNLRGIYLYHSDDNTIHYNNFSSNSIAGIFLGYSDDNEIANSIVSCNNNRGIWLQLSCDNSINNNIVNSNDEYGIYLLNADGNTINNNTVSSNGNKGACLYIFSDDNLVYHNNFINNSNQALEIGDNSWDNGYPSGGNYWSDYGGVDLYSGSDQDLSGSDGIGDSNYSFNFGQDNYPLISPFEYIEHNIILQEGWNMISLPVRQLNYSIDSVLESITGKWDTVRTYNSDISSWKSYNINRPDSLNDLNEMTHQKGYWININEPDVTLVIKGDKFASELTISLNSGGNLVGYPTLNGTMTVANALWGTSVDRVEMYDPIGPYHTIDAEPTDLMKPGECYWVNVPIDSVWSIDW